MILGLLLIMGGVLIALFPPLLSMIVSAFLIVLGILILLLAYEYRKHTKRIDLQVIDTIFRY